MLRRRTPRFLRESKNSRIADRITHLEVENNELQDRIDKLEEKIKDSFLIYEVEYKGDAANGDRYYTYRIGDRYFINNDIKLTFKITNRKHISLYMIDGLEPLSSEITGKTINAFAKMVTNISKIGDFAFLKLC
jgi:hypothetical protein